MNITPKGLAAAGILLVGFCFIALILTMGLARTNPAGRDYIEYWAAEQLLTHGGNPYEHAQMLQVERAVGFTRNRPELWYSPPPVLLLALPLGWLHAKLGLILWILFQFVCLTASLYILWLLHGRPPTLIHLAGYLFAPALLCLQAGQISILFLLGVSLFLYLHQRQPFLAGLALFPCCLKPHIFLVFATALLLWIMARRAYAIVGGFFFALAASSLVVWLFDPNCWAQYSQMMRTEGMLNEFIATLSCSLRLAIDPQATWLQFLPSALGCLWSCWYFLKKRAQWGWMDQGLLVLLVSVMCSSYGWFFDESVLLPALLTSVVCMRPSGRPIWPIALVAGAALVELQAGAAVMSRAFLWTTPAWLACYLYARSGARTPLDAPISPKVQEA